MSFKELEMSSKNKLNTYLSKSLTVFDSTSAKDRKFQAATYQSTSQGLASGACCYSVSQESNPHVKPGTLSTIRKAHCQPQQSNNQHTPSFQQSQPPSNNHIQEVTPINCHQLPPNITTNTMTYMSNFHHLPQNPHQTNHSIHNNTAPYINSNQNN